MGHWLTFANVDWAHRYDSGAGPRRTGVRQPWLDSAQDLQSRSAPADGPKARRKDDREHLDPGLVLCRCESPRVPRRPVGLSQTVAA